jgi:hypothetical protein
MLKPLLLASAMALALPAFAQPTNAPPVRQQDAPAQDAGAATSDHDPTAGPSADGAPPRPIVGVQVNGGVTTSGAGTPGTVSTGTEPGGEATARAGASAGVGGPLDIDALWPSISGTGADLTPLEFGTWLLETQGQDIEAQVEATRHGRSANLPAVQVLNVTAAALARADSNRDWRVSREELRAFAAQ